MWRSTACRRNDFAGLRPGAKAHVACMGRVVEGGARLWQNFLGAMLFGWMMLGGLAPAFGQPPEITGQPTSAVIPVGQSGSVSVTATGAGLSYQWFKDRFRLVNQTNSSMS